MSSHLAGGRVGRPLRGGKDELPWPKPPCAGIFSCKRVGKRCFAESGLEILGMESMHGPEMLLQGRFQDPRQHGDALLFPLCIADDNVVVLEIDVLHAQSDAFHESES